MGSTTDSGLLAESRKLFWLIAVVSAAMLLATGGLLAVGWQITAAHHREEVRVLGEIQAVQSRLQSELRMIVQNAPVKATEDLCQVRFRLRTEDAWGLISRSYRLQLSLRKKNEWVETIERVALSSEETVDFGLQPPGDYRLCVFNSFDMMCQYEFTLLLGHPVDRTILCPKRPFWSNFPNEGMSVRVKSDWPEEWKSWPVAIAYHIRDASTPLGNYQWRATEEFRFRRIVIKSEYMPPELEEALWETLPEDLLRHTNGTELILAEGEDIPIPFGTCELSAVTLFLDRQSDPRRFIPLGTYALWDEAEAMPASAQFQKRSEADDQAERLCWEFDRTQPTEWEVTLPPSLIQEIATKLHTDFAPVDRNIYEVE